MDKPQDKIDSALAILGAKNKVRLPGLDTLGDLCDKLCVCVQKLAWCENKKRELQLQDGSAELIKKIDHASRDECELRSQLKTRINELFEEVISSGQYKALHEFRTFTPPKKRFSDQLSSRYEELATAGTSGEIAKALEKELLG